MPTLMTLLVTVFVFIGSVWAWEPTRPIALVIGAGTGGGAG